MFPGPTRAHYTVVANMWKSVCQRANGDFHQGVLTTLFVWPNMENVWHVAKIDGQDSFLDLFDGQLEDIQQNWR